MQLRVQITLALGTIGLLTSLAVAIVARSSLVAGERLRFEERVQSSVQSARKAMERSAQSERTIMARICAADPVLDIALSAVKTRSEL